MYLSIKNIRILLLILITISSFTFVFLYARSAAVDLEKSQLRVSITQADIEKKSALLSALRAEIGYGGLIHNFKNYVLRGDVLYLAKARRNYNALEAIFAEIETLSLPRNEKTAFENLRGVVERYREKFSIAENSVARGLTPAEIDVLVKVDDTPAFMALRTLTDSVDREYRKIHDDINNSVNDISGNIETRLPIFVIFLFAIAVSGVWIAPYFLEDSENKFEENSGSHITDVLKEWPGHALVLLIGVSLSLAVAWMLHISQTERARDNFEHLAQKDFSLIENKMRAYERELRNLGSFYLSSENVDRSEFVRFTQQNIQTYQSFDAMGWIDASVDGYNFKFSYIQPDNHKKIEGNTIDSGSKMLSMIDYALESRKISYFISTLEDIKFHDIHHGVNGDSKYHLIMLCPVYEQTGVKEKFLRGISYIIIDYEFLMRETFTGKEHNDLLYYAIDVVGIGRKSESADGNFTIYGNMQDIENAPYRYDLVTDLSRLQLVWRFAPTQKFIEQYQTNNTYIVFVILCALTMAILFMRQMAVNMRTLKEAREKAEEASRLKSDFLATMSHEIRTPMNGIQGMAELILSAKSDEQARDHAHTIIQSSEILLRIIDDILDFSKIEAGRMEIEPMAVDMMALADDVIAINIEKAREKALELAVRYVPGSEQFVFADPVRMRQILGNLLSNAIKFTESGYIVLTIEEIKESLSSSDKTILKFSVADTGIGMNEKAIARIFDKFSQADCSTTRKYGGTGLGLSICQRLIQMMGGEIGVESIEGQGSTFWFTMPFARNESESHTPSRPLVLKGARILIVDDLPVIRQLLTEQLSASGMICASAADGQIALEMMQDAADESRPYNIVLVDYLMPEMNGKMLGKAIKEYQDFQNSCLIMLTAAGMPSNDDSFAGVFSAYIAKPIRGKNLVESLATILEAYEGGARDTLIRIDAHSPSKGRYDKTHLRLPSTRILVAEDNLVNQTFIRKTLEEMDASFTIVSNGQESLDAVQREDFDLVIMDCLMPVMDGFEAAQEMRKLKNQGLLRAGLPIIALTANAMKGDRERCLEAGMDLYLTKPVRKKALQEVVYSLITGENPQKAEAKIIPFQNGVENAEPEILNMGAVKEARETLEDEYSEMLEIYIGNSLDYIGDISEALDKGDIESVIRPAHTLKSTSRQMGAIQLSEKAREVEYIAKAIRNGTTESGETIRDLMVLTEEIKNIYEETRAAFISIAA